MELGQILYKILTANGLQSFYGRVCLFGSKASNLRQSVSSDSLYNQGVVYK